MTVLHLTAELAPMPGGIADYVAILGGELARRGLPQRYLVTGTAGGHRPNPRMFAERDDVTVLLRPSARELASTLAELRPSTVLLHYSGYGFARRGAPVWLAHGLSVWKRRFPDVRLVVMFHETWASSSVPWHSSFWLSKLQRWCVARIAQQADLVVTSNIYYAEAIKQSTQNQALQPVVLPIFSTVGEPTYVLPPSLRDPICIVFGALGRLRPYIDRAIGVLLDLGCKAIIDVGKHPMPCTPTGLFYERWTRRPSHAELSKLLVRARFGMVGYPPFLLTKSSTWAAYAAHGVCTLTLPGAAPGAFDLEPYIHFIPLEPKPVSLPQALRIADSARTWYFRHIQHTVFLEWFFLLRAQTGTSATVERASPSPALSSTAHPG